MSTNPQVLYMPRYSLTGIAEGQSLAEKGVAPHEFWEKMPAQAKEFLEVFFKQNKDHEAVNKALTMVSMNPAKFQPPKELMTYPLWQGVAMREFMRRYAKA